MLYAASAKTGSGTTFRHTTEDLYPEINSAYVEQQEFSVSAESSFYTEEGALSALPTSRVASDNYSLIDFPLATQAIARIDVLVQSEWSKLLPVEWDNMRDVMPALSSSRSSRPTHYAVRQFAAVAAGVAAAGKIALLPFCSSGQYKLSTLPIWTPITNTAHVFVFPNEAAFRWTVMNVVARMTTRDDKGKRYEKAERGMARAEGKMRRTKQASPGGTMRRAARRWG